MGFFLWTYKDDHYIFGGWGYSSDSEGLLSDVWRFEISSRIWTWVQGPSTSNNPGEYGTQGREDISNTPGGRHDVGTWTWNDYLFIFGGRGANDGYFSDVWRLDKDSFKWTWWTGPSTSRGNV